MKSNCFVKKTTKFARNNVCVNLCNWIPLFAIIQIIKLVVRLTSDQKVACSVPSLPTHVLKNFGQDKEILIAPGVQFTSNVATICV